MDANLAECQIPPLGNWTIPLSPLSPKGKGDYVVFCIGYSYGLEILVVMTPLYFANAIKKGVVIPTERTPGANGGI